MMVIVNWVLHSPSATAIFTPNQFSVYTYRNMATQKLSRAQIKAGLDSFPIESLLSSGKGKTPKLTSKQKAFAKAVALGETKAQAYRQAYNPNPAPSTIVNTPYKLAKNPRIQQEIEAIQLALSTAEHRQPAQIKALLIQQLLQHSIDEDFPPAQRVQCLKLLGSLYEVGAFMERKEVTTVKSSGDLRARLLATLTDVSDAPVKDDALDLLQEISGAGHSKLAPAEPTGAPPAAFDGAHGTATTHTIPDSQSKEKIDTPPSSFSEDEIVNDFDK
jgi:phage terminase small subunit